MTALAMIIGMIPMALGAGDGGEQNAPLGRAVVGGLMLATVATLIFVPAFFPAARTRHRELGSWRGSATANLFTRKPRRAHGVVFPGKPFWRRMR